MSKTGLIYLLIAAFNVCLLWVIDSLREKKADVKLADSLTAFLIELTGLSSLLIVINKYSYTRTVIGVTLFNVFAGALLCLLLGKKKKLKFSFVPEFALDYVSAGIIAMSSILTITRIKAYNPDRITELCKSALNVVNTDLYDEVSTPAYRAVIMLTAKTGDVRVLRVFILVLAISFGILIADICDNLSVKKAYKWITLGVVLINPITLYSAKIPTVNLYLALLVALAIREIMNAANNRSTAILALIPVAGIMLITLKTLFFMPLFIAVLLTMYAHDKCIERVALIPVIVFVQIFVFPIFWKICHTYFYSGWWTYISKSKTAKPISKTMVMVYLITFVIAGIVLLLPSARKASASVFADNGILKASGGICILVVLAAAGKIVYMAENSEVHGDKVKLMSESFIALTVYTGLIILPGAIIFMLGRDIKKPVSANLAIVGMVFSYGLFYVCCLRNPIVSSENTFADLTIMNSFIPYGAIMGAMMIENIVKIVKTRRSK